MLDLIRTEIFKIATKPRSYIGFAAIFAIVVIIQIALYADGQAYLDFLIQSLNQSFEIEGMDFNGNLVGFIILQTLIIQMPLLVALVSGDAISGEIQGGTIRSLLTKPVSRSQIVWAKFIAAELYTLLLILWLGILAWIVSLLFFGPGDLVVLKSDSLVIVRNADTVWRFLSAFGVAFLSLSVVVALSFLLSAFAENSIAPIIITMSVILLFTIIGTFDIPVFNQIKPFLFTTHMIVWRNFFDRP
ncbi:MAG: ABC transporter permease, partial [Thermoanaerobaculia bacterium]|nr:ABC transporter permease [Thermoanaerobaculia bacterium]